MFWSRSPRLFRAWVVHRHSELAGKKRWYHKKKMEGCNEKSIRLITIFEDEWLKKQSLVEQMLRNAFGVVPIKIGARKCETRQIEAKIANSFLKDNHIQGKGRANVHYGLFKQEELLSVMTFYSGDDPTRKVRFSSDEWEINRFCTKAGMSISGGASKLFSSFVKDFSPKKIVSYADLRWGTGAVYEKLDFKLEAKTVPNYFYFRQTRLDGYEVNRRYHRFHLRKSSNDPINKTEWETRQEEGWNRIWDCGHAKWVWTAKFSSWVVG